MRDMGHNAVMEYAFPSVPAQSAEIFHFAPDDRSHVQPMATSNQNPGTLAAGRSRATGTVASVTVVYNAAVVLSRHLQSLKSQSRKLDEIVVVDNASTDGTRGLLAKEYPDVTVLSLPENCGVGGGLAAGLEYAALQKKHDWVWIFDQDGVPERDSLARLLGGLLYLNGSEATTAVLAPVCVHPETGMICHGLSWRRGRLLPTSIAKDEPITFLDSVISSGSLVRRDAIEKVGLPRGLLHGLCRS